MLLQLPPAYKLTEEKCVISVCGVSKGSQNRTRHEAARVRLREALKSKTNAAATSHKF